MKKTLLILSLGLLPSLLSAQFTIWGVGSATGVADAEFQNAFTNATTANFGATVWTAQTISNTDGVQPPNAPTTLTPGTSYWVRTVTGVSQGAYATGMAAIASPSQTNGVALFDSDFYDNGGIQNAFGTGTAPSAQVADLVSPRIDLTGYTNSDLTLKFFCKWRSYDVNNFLVSMSVDDGISWTNVDINTLLPSSTNTTAEGWVTAPFPTVTQGVANLSNCRIRFRFDGDYYYTIVDDISIETACLPTASSITEIACDSYTSPGGNHIWTSSNTYMDTIPNAAGCDSIITVNLTINTVSDLTTTTIGTTISANNITATYQWLDCDNNYAVLSGETGQSFTATINGNYAVELTENGCVDTTTCETIITVGIIENNFGDELMVFPNPTNGNFTIDLGSVYESTEISISDINGKLIRSESFGQEQVFNMPIKEPNGIYLISVRAGNKRAAIRLIKN